MCSCVGCCVVQVVVSPTKQRRSSSLRRWWSLMPVLKTNTAVPATLCRPQTAQSSSFFPAPLAFSCWFWMFLFTQPPSSAFHQHYSTIPPSASASQVRRASRAPTHTRPSQQQIVCASIPIKTRLHVHGTPANPQYNISPRILTTSPFP